MSVKVTTKDFGSMPCGDKVYLYKIDNGKGMVAEIISFGAIIHRLYVPDRNGKIADVVLGRDTVEEYMEIANCCADFIGRVANRIKGAQFRIGDKVYNTEINDHDYTKHSASGNYAKKNFSGVTFEDEGIAGVKLSLRDNGEAGFPGGMDVSLTYSLDEDGNFKLFYEAMPEEDTPINFTNHVYFNLAGHDGGYVGDQILQIDADFYMPNLIDSMPTGEILAVKGTAMDFTKLKPMGEGFTSEDLQVQLIGGYDHNFCIRGFGMRRGGFAKDPASGRCLEFFTDMPGVQLYTAVHMKDDFKGKDNAIYQKLHSFCLETQNYTNAINFSQFPSMLYRAGEQFESTTIYRFYAE